MEALSSAKLTEGVAESTEIKARFVVDFFRVKIMRIAICDDETDIIDIIEAKLNVYFKKNVQDLSVSRFTSGKDLLKEDLSKYDVLFLDVNMPEMSGMDVATEIRKDNRELTIIFVTAFDDFVFESFKVNAFRYLKKPLNDKDFDEAMNAVCQEKAKPEDYLVFQFQNESYRIRYSDIISIEVMGDKIWIHCHERTYRWKGTLKQIMQKLEGRDFFQTHRSYVINMNKIVSYTSTNVQLEGECFAPISKYRLDEFKEEYIKHWSKIL